MFCVTSCLFLHCFTHLIYTLIFLYTRLLLVGGHIVFEIERKFLVSTSDLGLPPTRQYQLEQNYLLTGEESLRIRMKSTPDKSYFLTFKNGTGLVREELETQISEASYTELSRLCQPNQPLKKLRSEFAYMGQTLYMDTFSQLDLAIFEVEFANLAQSLSFVKPPFFGQEITDSPEYLNMNLWGKLNGRI